MTVEITSHEELRDLLGVPTARAAHKERTRLHERDREGLAVSPFCLVATAGADGGPPGERRALVRRHGGQGAPPGARRAGGIEQIFYHCAKAFLRSALWQPETWQPDALPSRARLIKEVEAPVESLEDLERHYGPEYATQIYV